jgi:hypothetical protein
MGDMTEPAPPPINLDQAWETQPEPGSGQTGPEVDALARNAVEVLGARYPGVAGRIKIERLVERPDGLYAVWHDTETVNYTGSSIHRVRRLDGQWKADK